MKLKDDYLRDLLARLDGNSDDETATATLDPPPSPQTTQASQESPTDRPTAGRRPTDPGFDERLAALRQHLAGLTGGQTSGESTPAPPAVSQPVQSVASPATEIKSGAEFVPLAPNTLDEVGLSQEEIAALALKYLFNRTTSAGRQLAEQLGLPFSLMEKVLFTMKADQLVVQKGAAALSDYTYQLTPQGFQEARREMENCSYFGTAPVPLETYIASVKAQSVGRLQPSNDDLEAVFKDLLVDGELRARIGEAVYGGKGFFLYGAPGNGKTSIAERIARAFGQHIWIPRTIGVAGEIIRLFDPCNHEPMPIQDSESVGPIDRRWIRIRRPTVIAGGELTMDRLEIAVNKNTGINEAPLQLKSNCGVLVIDDFGRQRMGVAELLNRWIVPLDRRYDFLSLPSGKTIQVPFDQLLVFSTNLEPRELVDEAFLRRISYKIEVPDPSPDNFRHLMRINAQRIGCAYDESAVEHLIRQHYLLAKRPFRACHARDLLDQVRSFCGFRGKPMTMSRDALEAAVKNYFGLMG